MSRDIESYILLKRTINKTQQDVSEIQNDVEAIETGISDYPSGYTPKGSVASASDLPASGDKIGDFYWVEDEENAEYVWNGTEWFKKLRAITNEQIDDLYEEINGG